MTCLSVEILQLRNIPFEKDCNQQMTLKYTHKVIAIASFIGSISLPVSFVVPMLKHQMANQCTKFEISASTHYEDMKGHENMQKLGWFGGLWVIEGHRQYNHLIRECTTSYLTLIETMCIS